MKKMAAAVLICVLASGVLAACGSSEARREAQPSATPIPGWERFGGGSVELWLPGSYEGGEPSKDDAGVITERLRSLGPDAEQLAQTIEQNPSMLVVWAFDSEVGSSGILTQVIIAMEKVPSAITLETYMDAAQKQVSEQFEVLEQGLVTLGDRQAGRLVLGFTIPPVTGKELMYVVKDDNRVWTIIYSTPADEFDQRLPVFEQSALNFTILP